jgi:probable F420-dependent oxidoreductase
MEIAVTLPQGGRAASPGSIKRTAVRAEELGYSHVWVNDHITHPEGQDHPSPYIFDPLLALTTAAAVTKTVGLGSQITASYYSPLWLANALASLDTLSNGRLTIAIGVGWSKSEFDALGSTFADRGIRTNEIIEILRTVWEKDYVRFDGPHYHLPPVRILPKPAHRIPIWIAGHSEPGYRRAVERGDGFHGEAGYGITASNLAERVARVRRDRPEDSFPFSVYTWQWDPGQRNEADILRERDIYEVAGVQHVVIALSSPDPGSYLRSVERLAEILELKPR